MKNPMRFIDRFCYKHPNFGVSGLMKYIAIGNAFFWIAGAMNPLLMNYLSFDPALILQGQVWRIISFIFIPPSTGLLAFIAIYFYYWLGTTLEQHWGTAQFNIYFFTGVLLTIIYGFAAYFITNTRFILTAQYIYLSMFFSFATLVPDIQVLLFYIIPVKMKYLAIFDAIFFIMGVLTASFPANLLPVVAVLNYLLFCADELLGMRRRNKPSAAAINFRKESQRIRREQQAQLYKHKCSVCGKTDTDYPELDFRYCSRCQGYHCFCEEHINNHIHFTE
ncbi:MAG: hypothetical protein IJ364_08435 [Oscillospiraceae bacterium]|nr:hypothetical protein [Oscillospiraceae bacterium]